MVDEKRRRTRVEVGNIEAQLTIYDPQERVENVPIHDISLKGLAVPHVPGLQPGARCTVTISPGPGVLVNIESVAVRSDDEAAALEFQEMDADSFYHLRRLVQLHSKDPDSIDRELTTPAFD